MCSSRWEEQIRIVSAFNLLVMFLLNRPLRMFFRKWRRTRREYVFVRVFIPSFSHVKSNTHTHQQQQLRFRWWRKSLVNSLNWLRNNSLTFRYVVCVFGVIHIFFYSPPPPFFCLLQKEYKGLSKQIAAQQSGQDGATVATQSGTNAGGILA